MIRAQIKPALVLFGLLAALTGLIYPLAVTGAAQVLFPNPANGSLIRQDGRVRGSALIGQYFDDPRYFWGRPQAASQQPNNATNSGGSNLGPTNPALIQAVQARVTALRQADPGNELPVPVDLVTASGSGLDPDISPAAAYYQAARVARSRGIAVEKVRTLVAGHTRGRVLGFLGEPSVNVLELNLALDALN